MFQGFSPETIDFLWGLRMNNNREWFEAHKQQYVDTLYQPMKELAAEISQPFAKIPGFLCKTSRIYRDMRMHPPVPYKESLWTCIRRDGTWWMQEPSLFFEIRPDGYSYGFLFWDPTVAMMNAMRRDMAAAPDRFLTLAETAQSKSGIPLTGKSYVRKKPCDDPRLDPYYSLRSMYAIKDRKVDRSLFSPALAKTVRKALEAWYPFCEYCQRFVDPEA